MFSDGTCRKVSNNNNFVKVCLQTVVKIKKKMECLLIQMFWRLETFYHQNWMKIDYLVYLELINTFMLLVLQSI